MADAFARYVSKVAAAGKKEYDIPYFAKCWLNLDDPSVLDLTGIHTGQGTPIVAGGGAKAGAYPSGEPVPHCLDIWRFYTREFLQFISPDLYLHDYRWTCEQYRYQDNVLFIPEQRADLAGVRRTWLAYGSYASIGCSPFGIDSVSEEEAAAWSLTYGLLNRLAPRILHNQAEAPHNMFGFYFDAPGKDEASGTWHHIFDEAEMELVVERSFVLGKPAPGSGLVLLQNGKFLLVGAGFQVTFMSTKKRSTFTGILSATEKELQDDGSLKTVRTMNGDETRSGACMIMPTENPDYGGFPIRVTIPARTYVAEVEVYSLEEDGEF